MVRAGWWSMLATTRVPTTSSTSRRVRLRAGSDSKMIPVGRGAARVTRWHQTEVAGAAQTPSRPGSALQISLSGRDQRNPSAASPERGFGETGEAAQGTAAAVSYTAGRPRPADRTPHAFTGKRRRGQRCQVRRHRQMRTQQDGGRTATLARLGMQYHQRSPKLTILAPTCWRSHSTDRTATLSVPRPVNAWP
jgi:hypothetical protein